MRSFVLTSAFCMLATGSQAGPLQIQAALSASLPVVRVADGCGPGFHLGPRGFCRPNGPRVVVARPVLVERPIIVARPVVVRPVPTCGVRVGPIAVRGVC